MSSKELANSGSNLPAITEISAQTILSLRAIAQGLEDYRTELRTDYNAFVLRESSQLTEKLTLSDVEPGRLDWRKLQYLLPIGPRRPSEDKMIRGGICPPKTKNRYGVYNWPIPPGTYDVIWPEVANEEFPKIHERAIKEIYPADETIKPIAMAYNSAGKIMPALKKIEAQTSNFIAHLLPVKTNFESWEITRQEVVPILTRSTGFLGLGFSESVVESQRSLYEKGSKLGQEPILMPYSLESSYIDFYLGKVLKAVTELDIALTDSTRDTATYAKNISSQPDLEMAINLANMALRNLMDSKEQPRSVIDALYFGNRINEIRLELGESSENLSKKLHLFPDTPNYRDLEESLKQNGYHEHYLSGQGNFLYRNIN
jgi:hypothetical protein